MSTVWAVPQRPSATNSASRTSSGYSIPGVYVSRAVHVDPSELVDAAKLTPDRTIRNHAGIGLPLATFARIPDTESVVAFACQFTVPATFTFWAAYQFRLFSRTMRPAFWPLTVGLPLIFAMAVKSPTTSFARTLPVNVPASRSTPVLETMCRLPGVVVPSSYAAGGLVQVHFGLRLPPLNSSDTYERSVAFHEIDCQATRDPGPPTFEMYSPVAPSTR